MLNVITSSTVSVSFGVSLFNEMDYRRLTQGNISSTNSGGIDEGSKITSTVIILGIIAACGIGIFIHRHCSKLKVFVSLPQHAHKPHVLPVMKQDPVTNDVLARMVQPSRMEEEKRYQDYIDHEKKHSSNFLGFHNTNSLAVSSRLYSNKYSIEKSSSPTLTSLTPCFNCFGNGLILDDGSMIDFDGEAANLAFGSDILPTKPCHICNGTGMTSSLVGVYDVAKHRPDCLICREPAHFGMATTCAHFYCTECIKGYLQNCMDTAEFPAYCPACRQEVPIGETPKRGFIEGPALTFLETRGVIDKEFQFRFLKQQLHRNEAFFSCPAKCGNFLLSGDMHFKRSSHNKDKIVVQIDKCPCGALVCVGCHSIVSRALSESHDCSAERLRAQIEAMKEDPAARDMILKLGCGKACPNCGAICVKTVGCDFMMCGTNCHGKVSDAIRNGGCGHIFHWSDLSPANTFFIDIDGNRRAKTDPLVVYPQLKTKEGRLAFALMLSGGADHAVTSTIE